MMSVGGLKKEASALLTLYLVLHLEVISEATAQGSPEATFMKRMTDWDAAVVASSLKNRDAVLKNMAPCMKMAAEIYNQKAAP